MSRIGRQPVTIPAGVEVAIDGTEVTVKGPKGTLSQVIPADMLVSIDDGTLTVERPTDGREHRSLHGLTRSLIANMVEGVTNGYEKRLEIVGVGYRAALKDDDLEFALGFSHPVVFETPEGIDVRGAGADPRDRARASTSSWSVKSPRTSGSSASQSRTRARASATRANTSGGRPARRPGGGVAMRSARSSEQARIRRHRRVRKKVSGTAERPRLAVFRSNRHIYAQLVDDRAARTLASASDLGAAGAVGARTRPRGRARSARRWRRPRRLQGSIGRCSTAVAGCTTAG